jgi:Ca-activated chloride channel homolog
MSSDNNNHPFNLPSSPRSGDGRDRALSKALAAFDEKYSSTGQASASSARPMSSPETISARPHRGRWMKREHMALAASIAVLLLSPIVVMRSGMLDGPDEQVVHPQPAPQKSVENKQPASAGTVTEKQRRDLLGGLAASTPSLTETEVRQEPDLPARKAPAPPVAAAPMGFALGKQAEANIGFRARGQFDASKLAEDKKAFSDMIAGNVEATAPTKEDGRERFDSKPAKTFTLTQEEPVSTFSVDVDTASYSFMRSSLAMNALPQQAAVRTEELINYFPYDYPKPESAEEPFRISTSVFPSPWAEGRKILHVGIKGYAIQQAERPRANLVLLVDVSGSMNEPNKLPLLQQSLSMLTETLDARDTVAIVTYAGDAGIALEPTPVAEKQKILNAIQRLSAGGSTAGAAGIRGAYALAEQNFDPKGVNRILLATDGDFNVGITNQEELKSYIARKRETGIFLSVLGFGRGNYNDALMQTLAQNGNGVAAYIDTLNEARKVLVEEATSSLVPIAKDVKIQVEFNPAAVSEYRLIGYETRLLRREDFNNDKVDAGDVGSGHTVTALYEFVPTGGPRTTDPLRYGQVQAPASATGEHAFVKLRYKLPKTDESRLMTAPIAAKSTFGTFEAAPQEARFATAVAGFGELLRGGQNTGKLTYDDVLRFASAARGEDPFGYRSEFLQLVRAAKTAR